MVCSVQSAVFLRGMGGWPHLPKRAACLSEITENCTLETTAQHGDGVLHTTERELPTQRATQRDAHHCRNTRRWHGLVLMPGRDWHEPDRPRALAPLGRSGSSPYLGRSDCHCEPSHMGFTRSLDLAEEPGLEARLARLRVDPQRPRRATERASHHGELHTTENSDPATGWRQPGVALMCSCLRES
jgi:hypothetical protein